MPETPPSHPSVLSVKVLSTSDHDYQAVRYAILMEVLVGGGVCPSGGNSFRFENLIVAHVTNRLLAG